MDALAIKLDENLPLEARDLLQSRGHDAMSVLDQALGGKSDRDIATVCREEARVLITLDTDFANILAYPPDAYPGIVVIRSDRQEKPVVLSLIERIADMMTQESPSRRLWIVEAERVRIRGGRS